ncbi:MAG: hypothetical protein ACI9VR_002206 [Cognaticolwellia sp.]|jgi:hypothetical protein
MGSCRACGQKPVGDERLISWLLSPSHLGQEELEEASARIAAGTFPRPSPEVLAEARDALNPVPHTRVGEHHDPDEPISVRRLATLFAVNLLATPLVGLTLWWFWRKRRPVAARQALQLSVPMAIGLILTWLYLFFA